MLRHASALFLLVYLVSPCSWAESMQTSIIGQPLVAEKRRKVTAAPLSHKIFGIGTYDTLFKHVLVDDNIRPSFLNAFVPNLTIVSSTRLDDHMNPINQLQPLRDFIHRKDTVSTVNRLNSSFRVLFGVMNQSHSPFVKDEDATIFFGKMLSHFDDMRKYFPKSKYDGTMDFVCKVNNVEYIMVELQVVSQKCWDKRALAYVAAFYGNQLRKGEDWKDIRKVIGINILGGGKSDKVHWKDTTQYVRHYKFQDQLHTDTQGHSQRYIDAMELVQYSIMNAPDTVLPGSEKQDWITFFKRGHRMNDQEVNESITTPEVLLVFERARLDNLPREVRERYVAEDLQFDRYSDHTNELVNEGIRKGLRKGLRKGEHKKASEIARKMLVVERPLEEIAECSECSEPNKKSKP